MQLPTASGRQQGQAQQAQDQQARPDKYDRILEAAIVVIAEKGLDGARISDIATRAGMADGTVYLYFESKRHILRAAIDHAFRQFLGRVSAAFAGIEDPLEQLRIIARIHFETMIENRPLAVILQTQVRRSTEHLQQFSHAALTGYLGVLRDTIRRGQQRGLIRAGISDRVAALIFFAAINGMTRDWLYTGRPMDAAQTAGEVMDMLLLGMRTKNP
jgi:TetR/AcrR family fatty acid metabolism transcriptional regulator